MGVRSSVEIQVSHLSQRARNVGHPSFDSEGQRARTGVSALHDRSGLQWPPGFAVFFVFVAGFAGDVGVEAEALAASGGFDGDDVPDLLGDDVGDDEIDFVLGVNVVIPSNRARLSRRHRAWRCEWTLLARATGGRPDSG